MATVWMDAYWDFGIATKVCKPLWSQRNNKLYQKINVGIVMKANHSEDTFVVKELARIIRDKDKYTNLAI